jgi:hypothetical protein
MTIGKTANQTQGVAVLTLPKEELLVRASTRQQFKFEPFKPADQKGNTIKKPTRL